MTSQKLTRQLKKMKAVAEIMTGVSVLQIKYLRNNYRGKSLKQIIGYGIDAFKLCQFNFTSFSP